MHITSPHGLPRTGLSLLALLLATGCSADKGMSASDFNDTGYGGDGYASDGGASDGGSGDSDTGMGSETEDSYFRLAPASTTAFVFVANPDRDTVTRIAVPSLEVITTEVGDRPTVVTTTSDYTKAVTFNEGSDSVSIIDAGTLAVSDVDVRPNFNNMSMSPDGRFVICWHDPAVTDTESSGSGAQSFNEISVVDTVSLNHTPLVVGFNPRGVTFTPDSSKAVVVSDAYVAVLDLTADELSPTRIAVSDDLVNPPLAEEIVVAPSGTYAFVRQFGATALVVVDLIDAVADTVAVGANPTDLDLTPDGTQAVAVARGSHELWVYSVADPFAPAQVVSMPDTETFGSVVMSPDGSRGLLYSTASGDSVYGTWELSDDSVTVRSLVKPVASVSMSPTGETALFFHPKDNGNDVDSSSEFYDHYGLTMVDVVDDFFPNPLRLPAQPIGFANSGDGSQGYMIMDGAPYLEVLHYGSLLYDEVELKSNPVFVGVLPESTLAYVSQEHALGRISFYDPDSQILQTITGFELNSGIEH